MCILRRRKNDMHLWHNRVFPLHSVYLLCRWCLCTYAAVCCVGIQVLHVYDKFRWCANIGLNLLTKVCHATRGIFQCVAWVQWIKGLWNTNCSVFVCECILLDSIASKWQWRYAETECSERISIWFGKHFVATNTHIYSLNEFKFLCLHSTEHTRWLVLHMRCSLVKRVHTHTWKRTVWVLRLIAALGCWRHVSEYRAKRFDTKKCLANDKHIRRTPYACIKCRANVTRPP